MADLATHEEQCRKLLGHPFTKIHQFLDQFNRPFENPFTYHLHRKYLHHWEGIRMIVELFGSWAVIPAIIHILEDCLGFIPHKRDYDLDLVDEYGRPIEQQKMDTHWFEKLQGKD